MRETGQGALTALHCQGELGYNELKRLTLSAGLKRMLEKKKILSRTPSNTRGPQNCQRVAGQPENRKWPAWHKQPFGVQAHMRVSNGICETLWLHSHLIIRDFYVPTRCLERKPFPVDHWHIPALHGRKKNNTLSKDVGSARICMVIRSLNVSLNFHIYSLILRRSHHTL